MVILINLSYRPCPYSYLLVGVVGSSSKGGEGGEFDKSGMPQYCKNSKEGRRVWGLTVGIELFT